MAVAKWIFKLLILILVTPFGFLLSFMPGYGGWHEWPEFCGMTLFNAPDGWLRGKNIVCYLRLIRN